MRSYMRNTESAGTIVPMVLDKTNACQRSNCADIDVREKFGSGTIMSSFALSRRELAKMDLKLCWFQVLFSSLTLDFVRKIAFFPGLQMIWQVAEMIYVVTQILQFE